MSSSYIVKNCKVQYWQSNMVLDNLTSVTLVTFPFNLIVQSIQSHQLRGKLVFHHRDRHQKSSQVITNLFFYYYCLTIVPLPLSYCRTSICCRQSVARIHRFLEVTSPPAPLPPLGGCSQGHASFKLTDFSGRYKATNQSHYRWLIKQPWWMVRLQTIHLLLHQIGDNTFSSETAREIKTPVNWEELSLRLIRCSAFKDALNSKLNIIRNNASIARCLAKKISKMEPYPHTLTPLCHPYGMCNVFVINSLCPLSRLLPL